MFQYRIVRLLSAVALMGLAFAIRWWFEIEIERFVLALGLGTCGAAAGGMIAGRSFAMIFASLGGIFASAGDPVLLEPMFGTAALVGLACLALAMNWSGVMPPLVSGLDSDGRKAAREPVRWNGPISSSFRVAHLGLIVFCTAPLLGAAVAYATILLGDAHRLDQFHAVKVYAIIGAIAGVIVLAACVAVSLLLQVKRTDHPSG